MRPYKPELSKTFKNNGPRTRSKAEERAKRNAKAKRYASPEQHPDSFIFGLKRRVLSITDATGKIVYDHDTGISTFNYNMDCIGMTVLRPLPLRRIEKEFSPAEFRFRIELARLALSKPLTATADNVRVFGVSGSFYAAIELDQPGRNKAFEESTEAFSYLDSPGDGFKGNGHVSMYLSRDQDQARGASAEIAANIALPATISFDGAYVHPYKR